MTFSISSGEQKPDLALSTSTVGKGGTRSTRFALSASTKARCRRANSIFTAAAAAPCRSRCALWAFCKTPADPGFDDLVQPQLLVDRGGVGHPNATSANCRRGV